MRLTVKQFKKFSDLVYHTCGINLHEGKQQLLQARLSKRLRSTGISCIDEYYRRLENDDQELRHFLDAVSTNHTYFFRESHHFDCLHNEHSNIWCAASSSGEEPYSIAIYCLEKGFRPTILATDISTKVLQTGQKGIYPAEKVKNIPQPLLKNYNTNPEKDLRVGDKRSPNPLSPDVQAPTIARARVPCIQML